MLRRNAALQKLVSKTHIPDRVFQISIKLIPGLKKRAHKYLHQFVPQCILIFRNVLASGHKHKIYTKRIFTNQLKSEMQVYHGEYIKCILNTMTRYGTSRLLTRYPISFLLLPNVN
jgi:hypothetical protein